jgi:hypothetical protein
MSSDYRPLSHREYGLIEKLLSVNFPGSSELRTQLVSLTAKEIEKDGTLRLLCSKGSPSLSKYLVAMEGVCKDSDGGDISVLLHINDAGFMSMLEIIKYGGSQIVHAPSAEDLVLLLPENRGGV